MRNSKLFSVRYRLYGFLIVLPFYLVYACSIVLTHWKIVGQVYTGLIKYFGSLKNSVENAKHEF